MKWKTAPFCPIHRKNHFYKYTSSLTAMKIFEHGKVRYSSPLLFNDPFDVQTELHFDFDIETLPQLIHDEIQDIIFDKKDFKFNENGYWSKAIVLLRETVRMHGYYAEELKEFIDHVLDYLKETIEVTRVGFNSIWKEFLSRLRVFSMSEINDNILMWSHYADFHRGAVLKLKIIPELDSPLRLAEPVIYKPSPPVFFTDKQWVEYILNINTIDYQTLHWSYPRTKSDIWSYEKEWRVWDLMPETLTDLCSDYMLYPDELEAVYFGCAMEDDTKNKIIELATMFNSNVTFYQAKKSETEYGLKFNKI